MAESYLNFPKCDHTLCCMDERLGQRIERLRLRAGLGQKELGRLVGLSESAISNLEGGKVADLKLPVGIKMAEVFGVSVVELQTGEDDTPIPPPNPELERLTELARGVLRLVGESARPSLAAMVAYHRRRLQREFSPEMYAKIEALFVDAEAAFDRMVGPDLADDPDDPARPALGRES